MAFCWVEQAIWFKSQRRLQNPHQQRRRAVRAPLQSGTDTAWHTDGSMECSAVQLPEKLTDVMVDVSVSSLVDVDTCTTQAHARTFHKPAPTHNLACNWRTRTCAWGLW